MPAISSRTTPTSPPRSRRRPSRSPASPRPSTARGAPSSRLSRSASMTSDWSGDVTLGVDAWTRRDEDTAPPPPPADIAEGPAEDAESVARKILLDQLTGQARSRKELADKLAK